MAIDLDRSRKEILELSQGFVRRSQECSHHLKFIRGLKQTSREEIDAYRRKRSKFDRIAAELRLMHGGHKPVDESRVNELRQLYRDS